MIPKEETKKEIIMEPKPSNEENKKEDKPIINNSDEIKEKIINIPKNEKNQMKYLMKIKKKKIWIFPLL